MNDAAGARPQRTASRRRGRPRSRAPPRRRRARPSCGRCGCCCPMSRATAAARSRRCVALLVAALATLAVPIAVRRMIDFGFSARARRPDRQLFRGHDRGGRPCSRWPARRATTSSPRSASASSPICASDVFGHLTALSAAFFDTAKTGETDLAAHRRHHPDQGRGRRLGFGRAAQSRAVRRRRHHDGGDEPAAVGLRAGRDPGDRAAAGRLRPRGAASARALAQDTLADASAYAAETIGAVRTLQAFTNESWRATRFAAAVERAFEAALQSTRARAVLTAIAIFLIFASVVVVLWVGAQDVLAGAMTPGRLSQFVLYAVFAAGALGQLSRGLGRGVAGLRRGRAAVRNSARSSRRSSAPAHPVPLPAAAARRGRVRGCPLRLSDAAGHRRARRRVVSRARRARRSRSSVPPAPARARSSI